MKPNNFKHSMLTVGVIAALGIVGTTANAGTNSGGDTDTVSTITNKATATYSIGSQAQPEVTSNPVTVNVNEVASFSLVAPQGNMNDDDINEAQKIAPGGSVNFKNILTNTGNLDDEYTIALSDDKANPELISGATDDFNYDNLADTDITLTVLDKDGGPVAKDPTGTNYPATIKPGSKIKLAPKHKAVLSYDVTPEGKPDAGKSGLMQLSATSKYIGENPTAGSHATVINEDQGIVTKPIFAIVKTATNDHIDLNDTSITTIQYTISVTNTDKEYSADATNVAIKDAIPANLELVTSSITVSGASAGTADTSTSTTNTLEVKNLDLAKGETVNIKFTVNITDRAALAADKSVTNHATVYDKFGDNDEDPFDSPDVTDSTDETTDDSTNGVDESDDDNDESSTVSFSNRGIQITDNNEKELPQTGEETVKHVITNTGNEAEGDRPGELTITVVDTTPSDAVKPTGDITVKIFAEGDDPETATPIATGTVPVDPDGDGTTEIDVNTISNNGIPAGGKAVVTYTEKSSDNSNDRGNPEVEANTTTITATLTDPDDNAAEPIVDKNTDTFNVKTMMLDKKHLLDENCDLSTSTATGFTSGTIDAKPGQCIIYRITAINEFTSKGLTAVTISDAKNQWDGKAEYVANSAVASDSSADVSADGTAITAGPMNIAANSSSSLSFKIKIDGVQTQTP